ncbi:hypothetical protein TDSAC_1314 [Thermodesulfobium acidiphilum]|uniref:Probable membrane transporter protein n=1 Tax=Thermodesulfobium acidiphilum TaxID=1794699 RepID=A0A2R4W1J1_THEAF|nr:TSUP family transporter [Thermodesulfobium acidiphilum]AWB10655.1 hypothetical protein TDSAC_1314 [Thermodesulfobium acidiphilum]
MNIILFLVVGLFTGVVSGMMGVGGGLVMIPAMVLFMSVPQGMAQGISLAAIVPISLMGAWVHFKKGGLKKDAILIGLGAILGASITSSIIPYIPINALKMIFSLVLFYFALRMILK